TVVIPTLSADEKLLECLGALEKQTRRDFEVMIVDNSGKGLAQQAVGSQFRATVVEPGANVGFATAVNLGFRKSNSPFVAPLNDIGRASCRERVQISEVHGLVQERNVA